MFQTFAVQVHASLLCVVSLEVAPAVPVPPDTQDTSSQPPRMLPYVEVQRAIPVRVGVFAVLECGHVFPAVLEQSNRLSGRRREWLQPPSQLTY